MSTEFRNVLVTGATGFVGRSVVRQLIARGFTPVCLVRSPNKLYQQHRDINTTRIGFVEGNLSNRLALDQAANRCDAVIHLVGIIIERRLQGRTFHKVHVQGTRNIVEAASKAGIKRFVHMSALGVSPDSIAPYQRTKWEAQQVVLNSKLDWTIFSPSVIHGPHGEFMQLLKKFTCGLVPPIVPYFGSGNAKVQPIYVDDVAHCFVESLFRKKSIGQSYPLGGPKTYSWIELYEACRKLMPHAKLWKPMVSLAPALAKAIAIVQSPVLAAAEMIVPSVGLLRFDRGQVEMAQHDSVCDIAAAESMFEIQMRRFEDELATYAPLIR